MIDWAKIVNYNFMVLKCNGVLISLTVCYLWGSLHHCLFATSWHRGRLKMEFTGFQIVENLSSEWHFCIFDRLVSSLCVLCPFLLVMLWLWCHFCISLRLFCVSCGHFASLCDCFVFLCDYFASLCDRFVPLCVCFASLWAILLTSNPFCASLWYFCISFRQVYFSLWPFWYSLSWVFAVILHLAYLLLYCGSFASQFALLCGLCYLNWALACGTLSHPVGPVSSS